MSVPSDPWIFHITHVDNLASMVADGCLWSDAGRRVHRPAAINIGYNHIKARRMRREVTVGAGGTLGEYVPFYFCPRSVMLYVISKGSSDYAGSEREIVHLCSRVSVATSGARWAFSDRHAEVAHAEFFADLHELGRISWAAVRARMWKDCREEKQAEFLIKDKFHWNQVLGIGVRDEAIRQIVLTAVPGATAGKPRVEVRPNWYYT